MIKMGAVNVKSVSVTIAIAILLFVWAITYFRRLVNEPVAAMPTPPSGVTLVPTPTPTDWDKCIDFFSHPLVDKFEIILRNKCGVKLNGFNIQMKFYDMNDNRIGWYTMGVNTLDIGERVRWQSPYPYEDYPALKTFGVGGIKVAGYSQGKDE